MHTIAIQSYRRGAIAFMILTAGFLSVPQLTQALPRFALQSGQSCASCHVNVSGAGQRTEGGWWWMKNVGLINPSGTFLEPLYSAESNTLFSPKVSWGFDYRFQIARRGFPTLDRDYFSMQLAPYVSYKPIEELTIYGAFNVVEPEYRAQQHGYAGVVYKPLEMLTVKAGYIQPQFGVRHDDHTTFTRIHGGGSIANGEGIGYVPYYAELGSEVYISPLEWLTVSGGLYSAKNRHDLVPQIDGDRMFYTANLRAIYPDFDNNLNYEVGASLAQYNEQTLIGAHAGFGWIDNGSLLFEYVRVQDDFQRYVPVPNPEETGPSYFQNGDVILVKASFEVIEGLSIVGRWEQARHEKITYSDGSPERHFFERQWVGGLQVFVLPNLELRPEYRWLDGSFENYSFTVAQWTLQAHLYY